ncbi:MAG TPA: anthranilate synthase component I family protein [Acidimicrobiia bacterium]|jgi:para-aminobenzoate synthetase component 1
MPSSISTAAMLAALPPDEPVAVVHDGSRTIVAVDATDVVTAEGATALTALDALGGGWWAGFISYECGHAVERIITRHQAAVPDLCLARFDARLEIRRDGGIDLVGSRRGRALLQRALETRRCVPPPAQSGRWSSTVERDEFESGVRSIIDAILAGDCYQVNLTRQRRADAPVDAIALWGALEQRHPAPQGSFIRVGPHSVVSASPELYLGVEGTTVTTRPIKGTGVDAGKLRASEKDRAENVMIVDMARNDLGRVCAPATIRVPDLCALERHPGLYHLVSTVEGELREDVGMTALVRATFPAASITGAPKPRVMQLIDDLEHTARGVYCGATGWIDAETRRARLAVAIRTFTIDESGASLGIGAGITADSDPAAEWAETELKASRLLALAGAEPSQPVAGHAR